MNPSADSCVIQAHGALLALAEHDLAIAMASENAATLLGVSGLLGATIADVFGAPADRELRAVLTTEDIATECPIVLTTSAGRFDAALHRAGGLLVIELEPSAPRRYRSGLYAAAARFHTIEDTNALARAVLDEVRTLTAFERVTLYRETGDRLDLVATVGVDDAPPSTPQLRAGVTRARYIADRSAPPVRIASAPALPAVSLPLAGAMLRYDPTEAGGDGARFIIDLMTGETRWGQIHCEHRTPHLVPLAARLAVERIALLVGMQLGLRDRLAAELRASSVAKDEFLALVSHELRTPLNAMLGWLRMIEAGHVAPDAQRTAIATVTRNANALAGLVEELLDVSRIVTGKMRLDLASVQPASIVEAALATVQPIAEPKGIRIATRLDAEAGPVLADAGRLQQVLWNLLSNAVKFTPERGHIEVSLARVPTGVEISVRDNGVGIAADFLPHVFEQFRQAPPSVDRTTRGLGLGLSIVRHLIEGHGGRVFATSPGVGKGATFTVQLPLATATSTTGPFPKFEAFAPVPELRGLRVLTVDDERDANELVGAVLAMSGVQVTTAASAAEVLELLPRVRPHVLISDIGMPEIDGYELITRVRKLPASDGGRTPAIAVTAFARPQDRSRAFLAGFDLFLTKPIDPAELTAVLSNLASREHLELPAADAQVERPRASKGALQGARVLVIDDDPDGGELLGMILERHGAIVEIATTAGEGAAKVKSFRPDVLVSDISLPDQDGYTFMRELRARGPDDGGWIPAIAISGHVAPDDVKRAILAGFQLHMGKPVDPQDLIGRLARLVGRTSRRT